MSAYISVYALIADPGGPSILAVGMTAGLNNLSVGRHSTPVDLCIPAETADRTGTYGCVPNPVAMRQGTGPGNGSCRLACLTVLIVTYWLFKKCLNKVTPYRLKAYPKKPWHSLVCFLSMIDLRKLVLAIRSSHEVRLMA